MSPCHPSGTGSNEEASKESQRIERCSATLLAGVRKHGTARHPGGIELH